MKHFVKHNILLILVVICLVGFSVFGIILAGNGHTISDDGESVPPAALGIYETFESLFAKKDSKNTPDSAAVNDTVTASPTEAAIATEEPTAVPSVESTPEPTPEVTPEPTPEPVPPHYEFGEVDDSYFSEACFIGDSRIHGLYYWGDMEEFCDFYSRDGMSVFGMMTGYYDGKCKDKNGLATCDYFCPADGMKEKQYKYIYIMTGLNECGTNDPVWFAEAYQENIDMIKELQPDAKIILLASLHVSQKQDDKAAKEGKRYDNQHIYMLNEAAQALTDNETVFWLDPNEVFDDENGKMDSSLTGDGMHFTVKSCGLFKDFLYSHGLVLVP